MSDQLTPNQVAAQLAQLARDLDHLVTDIDAAEKVAINAREDYTMLYAQAYMSSEGSIEARKHISTIGTHEPRVAAELAEQHVKAIRRQIDSVRIRIDVGRSLGAALRAEFANLGGGA
jgi:hypothetical protein